jgi:arylsulfatase A-like enzyme
MKNPRMRRIAAAVLSALSLAVDVGAQTRPNVILILADDLGYGDVGAFNPAGRIPTPHLDRLAREGLRLTDVHAAAALCTPTRYGLLTGRYPWRTRLRSGVLWGNGDALIEPGRTTVASLLRDAGYHTAGIGKWHLGLRWAALPGTTPDRSTNNAKAPVDWIDYGGPIADGPTHHGFANYFGLTASLDMRDYVYIDGDRVAEPPTTTLAGEPSNVPAFYRPGRAGASFRPEAVLGELTSRAVRYVRERAAAQAPFFLYFALASPHTPVLPTAAFAGRTGLGPYADFVAETDAAIGQVLEALEQSGAAKNTLIIFTSDNGPAPIAGMIEALRAKGHDSAGGWRGAKQDIYEGGHRVPTIVRWPGVVSPGTTSKAVVSLVDVLATVAEIVGRPLPADAGEDSVSFLPVLHGPGTAIERPMAMVMQSGNGSLAIRDGRWKLCLTPGSGGLSAPVPGSADEKRLPPAQLFDLDADPSERTNLQDKHPEIVQRLTSLLETYRKTGRSR